MRAQNIKVSKTKSKKLLVEDDLIKRFKALRRLEEIYLHGKPVSQRYLEPESKKIYKRNKKYELDYD